MDNLNTAILERLEKVVDSLQENSVNMQPANQPHNSLISD